MLIGLSETTILNMFYGLLFKLGQMNVSSDIFLIFILELELCELTKNVEYSAKMFQFCV